MSSHEKLQVVFRAVSITALDQIGIFDQLCIRKFSQSTSSRRKHVSDIVINKGKMLDILDTLVLALIYTSLYSLINGFWYNILPIGSNRNDLLSGRLWQRSFTLWDVITVLEASTSVDEMFPRLDVSNTQPFRLDSIFLVACGSLQACQ